MRNFDPTTGVSKTRLFKKPAKYKLDNLRIDPKYWITNIELLRGDLKMDVHIDYTEKTTHIISRLNEAY